MSVSEWVSDIIVIALTGIIVFSFILIPKYLKEKAKISQQTARSLIHALSGLGIFVTPYLHHPILAGFLALALTFITRTSGRKSRVKLQRALYDAIKEEEELEVGYLQGPFAYTLAITVLVFIFTIESLQDKFYFPIAAILIMMYADTFAGYIGRKYGKHHIHVSWVGSKRTIEGSLAFLSLALVCSAFTFFFFGQVLPGNSMVLTTSQAWVLTLVLSFSSMLLELVSPSKYDDLIVPLGSTLIISLVALGLHIW
jgi:dolichol kinase